MLLVFSCLSGSTPPAETRTIPPAHLSPLPNNMPVVSRKKKKKKKRLEHVGIDDGLPNRGYVAAIPPPLHQNQPPPMHPPPAAPQRGAATQGGMVGGAGNVRPSSSSLRPMPKKRQSASIASDEEHRYCPSCHWLNVYTDLQ